MNVLVLRPERAAVRTAEALTELGHAAILAPVLVIDDVAAPIPNGDYGAVLATSANGVRKLKARPEIGRLTRLPLIAVGDRTAQAGQEAGFATVHVAEGDGRALIAEAVARFPRPARFLHAAGADRAYDLAAALAAHGHTVDVVELYRATAATRLPDAAREALADRAVDAVLHHSRRIAETFLALVDDAGFDVAGRALPHAALAHRVAEPLLAAGCMRVMTAERPDEPALLATLATLVEPRSQSGGSRSS